MAIYFILSSLVLAVSAGLTFSTKKVTHQQTLICLFLFPIIYLASGLPLAEMTTQILVAALIFVIGSLCRLTGGIGGGVIYAVTIAALYVPSLSLLFNYLCLAAILGGVHTLVIMVFRPSSSTIIRDYAAVVMAVGSGFFLYQFSEVSPNTAAPTAVQTATAPAPEAPTLSLRGLSD